MSIVVQFGKSYASFSDGRWSGTNPAIQQILNGSLRRSPIPEDCPDPDGYALQQAKDRLPTLQVIRIGPEGEQHESKVWKWVRFFFFRGDPPQS